MRRNRDCANSLEAKDATPANTYVMVLCGILSFAYLLGEHHVRNVGVVGSNPIISTTEPISEHNKRSDFMHCGVDSS